jgi:diguanylate cyclase (GGDEF)-like protein
MILQARGASPFDSLPRAMRWLLVPVCYYAAAKLGVAVAVMPEGVAILWPANSVLLTAMLLMPNRHIPAIAGLGIVAEVAADWPTFSLPEALIFGVANALEATVACLLLKAWGFDPRLSRLADLRKFLLAGPLLGALLAAALGAAAYARYRGGDTGYFEFLRVWFMGDAIGLLIFAPLLLSLALGREARPEKDDATRFNLTDAVVVSFAAAILLMLVLERGATLFGMHVAPVLVIPCVVYLAARFDLRVVSAAVAVAGVAIAYATAHDQQPFGDLPPHEASMRAQEFILSMSLLGLGLAALLGQLRAKRNELRLANERLDQANRSLELRVAERTAQIDETNRQLQRLAMTDSLTGLANRRAFFAGAQGAVAIALRHERPLAAMMIDIDRFKPINDTYGHAAGDRVLQHVAATLRELVRGTDTLARHGGEEFVLLAPETGLDSALALARRMGDALRDRPVYLETGPITVTASFGVTALGGHGDDLDRMMQRADAALYECKKAGRDLAIAVAPPNERTPMPSPAAP